MKISPNTDLLELSTMIHVVRNQIKCILIKARPRDISLARLRDLICRVYHAHLRIINCARVPIITQVTFDRIRLYFRMKVRFSDSFLASHRINQRERMQKHTCHCSWHTLKFSPRLLLLALRAFVLSYAIHFRVYQSQREVQRTDHGKPKP